MSSTYADALRRQVQFAAWWLSRRGADFTAERLSWVIELGDASRVRLGDEVRRLESNIEELEAGRLSEEAVEPPDRRLSEQFTVYNDDNYGGDGSAEHGHDLLNRRSDVLRRARTYYVAAPMVGLVNAAYYSRPPQPLREDHLPCPSGFMWLESPALYTTGKGHSALQWEPATFTARDGATVPAVRISAWLLVAAAEQYLQAERGKTVDYQSRWGEYIPWSFVWPFGREEAVGETVDADVAHCSRWAQSAWSLMSQPLVTVSQGHVERHARKQAQRDGLLPEVSVITLRAAKHAPSSQRTVDWSHRWLVRGFWRNQWYPAAQEHRPLWIDDYVKGPEDRPFLIRDRVTVWKR